MKAILEDLAAGRIDPAEASRRIDALPTVAEEPVEPREATAPSADTARTADTAQTADGARGDTDAWAQATDRPQHATYTSDPFPHAERPAAGPSGERAADRPTNTSGVERIAVRAVGRRVRIVGESAVATVSADGPHVLRRNGSVLEISSDGEMGSSLDGFSIFRAPRNLEDIRSLGLGKELFLRVNPAIVVDAEVTAGSLHTEQVAHLGKIRVTAGGARLFDVAQAEDVLVQAGQATIRGTITAGRSRVRAESGSLSIQLGDSSNVTIKADSQLGHVSWTGGHSGAGDEVVMGTGAARLDVEVVMGHAQVKVGSDDEAEAGVG